MSASEDRVVRNEVRSEIREFLTTRRARTTPDMVGLPVYGAERRRVPGLRREEVAMLAGISAEYYTRLERGTATGVSEGIIEGVARALTLDDAERKHLVHLLHSATNGTAPRRRAGRAQVRPGVQAVLDSMSAPAYVNNARLEVLAANDLGRALWSPVLQGRTGPVNIARFLFLDPDASDFFREWDRVAADTVSLLRAEAGRDPYDKRLSDLVGELCTRSPDFRVRWAAHNVRAHSTGAKLLHHPVVGDLDLTYEAFPLTADASADMVVYLAEPGSASADALRLLASWSAPSQTTTGVPADL